MMSRERFLRMLAWSTLINYLLLLIWFVAIVIAHDWVYKFHSQWFSITEANFDMIHYFGMLCYKLFIIFFNLIPYLILRIIG